MIVRNGFCAGETTELPPSFQDNVGAGLTDQTHCVWLISCCPFGTGVGKRFAKKKLRTDLTAPSLVNDPNLVFIRVYRCPSVVSQSIVPDLSVPKAGMACFAAGLASARYGLPVNVSTALRHV